MTDLSTGSLLTGNPRAPLSGGDALSVFGWRQVKAPSEITHEVALTLVAYHCHDLFHAQPTGCCKVSGLFHPEASEIFSRRESRLSFEKAAKVRWREIGYLCQFGQSNPTMK